MSIMSYSTVYMHSNYMQCRIELLCYIATFGPTLFYLLCYLVKYQLYFYTDNLILHISFSSFYETFKRLDLILLAAGYTLVTETKQYVSNVSNLYIICKYVFNKNIFCLSS